MRTQNSNRCSHVSGSYNSYIRETTLNKSNESVFIILNAIVAAAILIIIRQVGTYFTEVKSSTGSKYVPRSVQIDLEAGVTNRVRVLESFNYTAVPIYFQIRSGPLGQLFRPDTYLTGDVGAGNIYFFGTLSFHK